MENLEKELRQVCTYYSDREEGMCGYNLSEEQFSKVMALLAKHTKEEKEKLRDRIVSEIINSLQLSQIVELYRKEPIDEIIKRVGSEDI